MFDHHVEHQTKTLRRTEYYKVYRFTELREKHVYPIQTQLDLKLHAMAFLLWILDMNWLV